MFITELKCSSIILSELYTIPTNQVHRPVQKVPMYVCVVKRTRRRRYRPRIAHVSPAVCFLRGPQVTAIRFPALLRSLF